MTSCVEGSIAGYFALSAAISSSVRVPIHPECGWRCVSDSDKEEEEVREAKSAFSLQRAFVSLSTGSKRGEGGAVLPAELWPSQTTSPSFFSAPHARRKLASWLG